MQKKRFLTIFIFLLIILCIAAWEIMNIPRCITETVSQEILDSYSFEEQFTLRAHYIPQMQQLGNTKLFIGNIIYQRGINDDNQALTAYLVTTNEENTGASFLLRTGDVFTIERYQLQILSMEYCQGGQLIENVTYGISVIASE